MKAHSIPVARVFCALVSAALTLVTIASAASGGSSPVVELPSSYIVPELPMLATPNPAVAYCEGLGYPCDVIDEEGGQRSLCLLPDGRRVDAWAFFRGEVAPEYSWCAMHGLRLRTKTTDNGSYVSECAVCVSDEGEELGTVEELSGLRFDTIPAVLPPGDEDLDGRGGGLKPRQKAISFGGSPPAVHIPSRFDWRDEDGTTAIKDQGPCGSCWAFSTVGAFECNILIKDAVEVDLSEQYLISCNQEGWSCGGGGFAHGYHMLDKDPCGDFGAVLERDFPYAAMNLPCGCPYEHPFALDAWGYIPRAGDFPEENDIKRHIMEYGPVSAGVLANSSFSGYRRGVYYGSHATTINHAIVLVGWDDNQGTDGVWFLRNSWGTMWGEMGYMRIAYGSNAVGYQASWVEYRDPIRITVVDVSKDILEPGEPLTVTVRIEENSDSYIPGTAVVHCRAGSVRRDLVPLESAGGGLYQAALPGASCGDTLCYFLAAAGERYGTVYNPRDPRGEVFRCPVGYPQPVFSDDFETDTGWTVEDGPELTGGTWERGVPVGGGDRSDPPTDYDGSGSCYLTENVDGDSDVDKDYTRLISPVIDLRGGTGAVVTFAYWYRNDRGDNPNWDYFVTSLSNDGGETWVPADTIGPRAPLPVGWRPRTILVGDHLALTDQMRVRIEVADRPGGSLIEAGVDDFAASLLRCDDTGDRVAEASDLALHANAPNPFGTSTVIRYELPHESSVRLTVHSASGRLVRTLLEGAHNGAGPHAERWDGRDDGGRRVAAGVYFYRLDVDGETQTAKMILLR